MEDLQGGTLALEHRYQIDARLESAGLITLYTATQDPFLLPVRVAVYDGLPEAGGSPALIERIKTSAALASSLDLPGILHTADYGEIDTGLPFVIEESLPGTSLQALLSRKGVLSPEDVATLIDRLATLLQKAHDRSLFHGNLQPRWIILPEGKNQLSNARLGHFGLGFSLAELRAMPQAVLTTDLVEAFPPEAFDTNTDSETPHLSSDADQWALAALAYRLLVGVHPFFDDPVDASEGILRITSEEAPPLTDMGISTPISDAIARALRKNPARRWPSIQTFARELHQAVHGPSTSVDDLSSPSPSIDTDPPPSDPHPPRTDSSSELSTPATIGPRPSGYLLTFALLALILSNLAWFFFSMTDDQIPPEEVIVEEASTLLAGLQLHSTPPGAQIFFLDSPTDPLQEDALPIATTPYVLPSSAPDGGTLHVLLRLPGHLDQRLAIDDTTSGQDLRLFLVSEDPSPP